jgi:hypothetical protein
MAMYLHAEQWSRWNKVEGESITSGAVKIATSVAASRGTASFRLNYCSTEDGGTTPGKFAGKVPPTSAEARRNFSTNLPVGTEGVAGLCV